MRLLERQTERETERERKRGGLSGPSELFHVPAIPASRFFIVQFGILQEQIAKVSKLVSGSRFI